MRTFLKTVYTYAELSDSAKSAAREWWRGCENQDFDTDSIFEDASTIARMLGVEFKQHPVKLMNGTTRYDPAIIWSGFSSQGDGASFEGSYSYAKGALAAVTAHTGGSDKVLAAIATRLTDIQRRAFYRLSCAVSQSGGYSHAYSMRFEFDGGESAVAQDQIAECLRDFANWIYRQLEAEYEYRMSDANVAENIEINGYEFNADGKICASCAA